MAISFNPIDPSTQNLDSLVNSILGNGLQLVSGSVVYNGVNGQGSIFTGGDGTVGIASGILLTSGSGTPATSNTSTGFSVTTNSGGDADLTAAGGQTSYDANTLEFKVISTSSTVKAVTFTFAFGSEEYPEFVNSYPDIGGILVNGTNYAFFKNGQPLTVNSANIATGAFQDNTGGGIGIEYDGISSPLSVTVNLQPGENTIKLGAADLNDTALDSGLFVGVIDAGAGGGGGSININPIAQDDTATTKANTAVKINVLANDTDPDGTITTVAPGMSPSNGTVVVNTDNSISYTPNKGYVGTDTFTYVATDNAGGQDTATVTVKVDGSQPPPSTPNKIIFGNTDISPGDIRSVSDNGSGANDKLQSGYSNGSAYQDFQQFHGGNGNDTFILRAKDFGGTTEFNGINKYITDFQGAGGYSAGNNDFLSFTGFGAGSTLTFEESRATKTAGVDTIDVYRLHDASNGKDYDILIHSLNGKHLAAGDFAFYA